MTDQQSLKVLYLSAEAVPFAKTGGLADVAGSLPKAIRTLGHDIRLAMPRYGRVEIEKFGLVRRLDALPVPMDERTEIAGLLEGRIGAGSTETPVYFVDSPRYFDRQGIYMYPDDAERFIFFARAALEACRALDWQPDVIHCNEWHTALVPNWLKTTYRDDPFFARTATIYTAHNLEYQGVFGYRVLEIAGLSDLGYIAHPDVAPDLNEVVDMMARGLLFADIINTVSETYAREILTPEFGHRLDPIVRDRRDRLFGILNGIDTELYDPATDPHIAVQFDVSSIEKRAANKAALQEAAGLPVRSDVPVISLVARLTDQKGLDLVSAIAEALTPRAGLSVSRHGHGRIALPRSPRIAFGQPSQPDQGVPDLRAAAGAADLRRQRHLPDAVPVRAVRDQSDGRHALRLRAGGACRRRAGRHRERLSAGDRSGQRFQL